MNDLLTILVNRITQEAEDVLALELVATEAQPLPAFTAGAHLDIHLPNGMVRQYSLCNDPHERHRYVIAVLREPKGRGGSAYLHDTVREGTLLRISAPRNHFPLHEEAANHILIAGGIGITPMLAMARRLAAISADFTLHYCTRTVEKTAFLAELTDGPLAGRVQLHHDGGDPSKGLDLNELLRTPAPGTHVYCCGPGGFINAVMAAGSQWPEGTLHSEYFAADPATATLAGSDFEVEIASTGAVYQVPADKTILAVLLEHGHDIDSSCSEGLCGTCIVNVLGGEPDHRDLILDKAERASNSLITVCCSRAKTPRLTLDL